MTDQPLLVRTDRRLVRAVHHSSRYALVEIAAPPATATATRPRVNVAFVLDRSGSMGGRNKIGFAKEALREGIERLASTDRFSVVVYDNDIEVVSPGRMAEAEAKRDALRSLQAVEPRGSTNLGEGWLRGAEQVATALDPEAVNRVLLLTDGLANQGITDPAELERHAAGLRARGVSTSTFGVGEDFDERLLGAMADAGGGAFRFIGKPEEIRALIASEVGEVLEMTAKDVDLRIAGPDGLRIQCLSPYPLEHGSRESVLHIGDLVADQAVRFILALGFPLGDVGREVGVELALADRGGRLAGSATLTWTFADGAANDHQSRDREVDRVVARTYADRALRDAVDLNRRGEWDEARSTLRGVARRVKAYAGSDEVLRGIVAELEREAEAWSVQRVEYDRKVMYSQSVYALKSRAVSGAAMRRPMGDDPGSTRS
jgi:Ca-activated chloride channel family protein